MENSGSKGKFTEFDSDPEGKGFIQFGVLVSVAFAMCRICVLCLTYGDFFSVNLCSEYYTPLQTVTIGCAKTTSDFPPTSFK